MKTGLKKVISTFLWILLALSLIECNSSPTVPIPPPEATMIIASSPDVNGIVTVTGAPATAEYGDIILVFNDNTGDGAMKEARTDGSFEVKIRAQVTHILVIQIKRGETLSDETEITVP
jgi:hypothetical protein